MILAIIYIETGFFLGFVLPGGDYMLFAAGIFCGTHYLDIPIYWLVTLLITASFLGDVTGYFKGKWVGQKLSVQLPGLEPLCLSAISLAKHILE